MSGTNARRPTVADIAAEACRGLLGVLLPDDCPLCGKSRPPAASALVCDECDARLPGLLRCCRRCSAPIGPFLDENRPCAVCSREHYAFEAAFAADEYQDLVRSAVLAAKRAGGGPAARWMADRIWERRGRELAALGIDLVVPVPQHWTRRLLSSHNPAEVIARRLAVRLNARFSRHILLKTRRTPVQARLTPSARRANLRRAFAATARLDGARVLLTDDVLTTGTTADRATRALLDAGAETVWVAAAARGVGR